MFLKGPFMCIVGSEWRGQKPNFIGLKSKWEISKFIFLL